MKEKAIVQGFENNLDSRNRKGIIWHVLFQASTIVGIIALIALMLNVIDSAFGYVAYEARVDPDTLARGWHTCGRSKQRTAGALLQSTLSSGAYNKLDNEKPLLTDHARKYYQLVVERIIRPKVVQVWKFWPSLTQADEIRATVTQEYPKAELDFVSWLT
jgi:phosphate transport system permease protein